MSADARARHAVRLRSFQSQRRLGVLSLADEGRGFCVGLAGQGPPCDPPDQLSRLLWGAIADATGDLDPRGVAAAVDRRLRASDARALGPLCFAAALAGPRQVEVCTAGDLRVHLVEDERVTRVTTDHILRDDAPPDLPESARTMMPTMLTRTLGGSATTTPQSFVWAVHPPYRIVVCSDEYHRHQRPEVYWPKLAADLAAGRIPFPLDPGYLGGLVVELSFG